MDLTFLIYNNIKVKCQAFRLLIHISIQIYLVITFKNTENTCLFVLWIKALFGLMKVEGKKKKKKGMTFLWKKKKDIYTSHLSFLFLFVSKYTRGNTFFSPLFFLFLTLSFLFSSLPFPSTEPNSLRTSPVASLNFVLFGEWTVAFTFYLLTFLNTHSNKLSIISLSHLNIIFSFFL